MQKELETHTGSLSRWGIHKSSPVWEQLVVEVHWTLIQYCYTGLRRFFWWQIIQHPLCLREEELTSQKAGFFAPWTPFSCDLRALLRAFTRNPLEILSYFPWCFSTLPASKTVFRSLGPSCAMHWETGGYCVHLFQWGLTPYWSV